MAYPEEDVKQSAYEQYQEALANASGVDYESEDPVGNGEDLVDIIEPFDPTQIRIDSRQMSLDTLINRLRYSLTSSGAMMIFLYRIVRFGCTMVNYRMQLVDSKTTC